MSSSDGWPLSGPMRRVSRAPPTSVPNTKVEQQQRDAGRGPGVLVAAQPAVRPDDDRRASSRSPRPRSSQTSWTSPSPSSAAEASASTRSCGSRCISSRQIPPSIADDGQQDLVGAAPGEDEREVGREQRAEVDGEAACRGIHSDKVDRSASCPSDRLPTTRATATSTTRPAGAPRSEPAGARPDRPEDARRRPRRGRRRLRRAALMRRAPARGAGGPGRSAARRRSRAGRPPSTGRPFTYVPLVLPEVLDVPAPAAERQHGVLGRRERVVDDDRVVDVAAERGDRVERERPARPRARRRARRPRPAGPAPSPGSRAAAAGRAAAPGRSRTGTRYSRARNRIRTTHSTSRKPSIRSPVPGDLDRRSTRVAELDPVAGTEHDLRDRHAVDARAVRAPEVACRRACRGGR